MYVYPPAEWKQGRADPDDVWLINKQLTGQRAGANRLVAMVASRLGELGWERNAMYLNLYRLPNTRLVLDTHVDGWQVCGRVSEVTAQLALIRSGFRLKATGAIVTGSGLACALLAAFRPTRRQAH